MPSRAVAVRERHPSEQTAETVPPGRTSGCRTCRLPIAGPAEEVVPYAELHAHSNFSFLDGASSPEQLLEEAQRLGLHALGLTDHDGFYGIVRMAEAAESYNIKTVFGAELSLGLSKPQNGEADPEGSHLVVLARGEEGYHRLAGALTCSATGGRGEGPTALRPGRPVRSRRRAADRAHRMPQRACAAGAGSPFDKLRGRVGSRGGSSSAAGREVDALIDLFGRDNVLVELFDHGDPLASSYNDALAAIARSRGLPLVATGNVHYATPDQYPAGHRCRCGARPKKPRRAGRLAPGIRKRPPAQRRRDGGAVRALPGRGREHGRESPMRTPSSCGGRGPGCPKQQVPEGHTPMSWLRKLVWDGAAERYPNLREKDRDRIERELRVIEQKDFPGYFLIVWDIVRYAKSLGILCQGRGSAANSAVCYLLKITAVDAIFYDLPFERFLSSMRDEEPDIDVDFDSDRREEVIQYVYAKYGRQNAAQVANVISYRPKNAVRDMAKALGHSPGQQDAWSKQVERWGALTESQDHDIPRRRRRPRARDPEVSRGTWASTPAAWCSPIVRSARCARSSTAEWMVERCCSGTRTTAPGWASSSSTCWASGCSRRCSTASTWFATMSARSGRSRPSRRRRPASTTCCAAPTRSGYSRSSHGRRWGCSPGCSRGASTTSWSRSRWCGPAPSRVVRCTRTCGESSGQEPVTYLHPKLREPLERTLGIPVFQEQLMQVAMAVGGCTGEDADLLRRAMGSKRGIERIESLRERLYEGMKSNGIEGDVADEIYGKIQAFANFGFAESHSLSFGLLVYASSWMRLHYPGAFLAALLRAQPMGFYSPQTLVADARRHGVTVLRPDIQLSGVSAGLEAIEGLDTAAGGLLDHGPRDACLGEQPPVPPFDRSIPFDSDDHRRDGDFAVRLGLDEVSGISTALATKIVEERTRAGEFANMNDLVRRVGLSTAQLELLSAAGAFDTFGLTRREAMWNAGNAAQDRAEFLEHTIVTVQPPLFTMPSEVDELVSDLWATGMSTDNHPVRHLRSQLTERGVFSAASLKTAETGSTGRGRRCRDASPAPGDGERHHFREPRGRDRAHQHHLQRRRLESLPTHHPGCDRDDRPRHPRTLTRGRDQPAGRQIRGAADDAADPVA